MAHVLSATRPPPLDLPPAFTPIRLEGAGGSLAHAASLAAVSGAGTLVWADDGDLVEVAVVLEPDELLATARRAFFVGMEALAIAIGKAAPPDKPLTFDWPDAIRFDGARIGGGRLAWPEGCREDERPDWLVFGGTLLTSKAGAGDPGLTPDTTSLAEEGFDPDDSLGLVEAFARHLMWAFDRWSSLGFDAVAADYLMRLPRSAPGERFLLAENGDLLFGGVGPGRRLPLLPALIAPTWLDPTTGAVRL